MKGLIIYRILSILVNIFAVLMAISFIPSVMMMFANPAMGFGVFLTAGVMLYAWFANKFYQTVLVRQMEFTKKQIDWLQANAIVALVFSLMCLQVSLTVVMQPSILKELLESFPQEMAATEQILKNAITFLLVISLILLVHISWTYVMLRAYKKSRNSD